MSVIKSNDFVERAVITGISYIEGSGLSGLNNLEVYKFLHDHSFVYLYGFLKPKSTKFLKSKFNVDVDQIDKAPACYEGYTCRKNLLPGFCSKFLQYGIVRSYCRKRGRVEALDNAFRYSPIEETIRNMLGDGCIQIELVTDITVNHITKLTNLFVDKPT